MICSKCGSEVNDNNKFCNKCGNPMKANPVSEDNIGNSASGEALANNSSESNSSNDIGLANNNESSADKSATDNATANKKASSSTIVIIIMSVVLLLLLAGLGLVTYLYISQINNANNTNVKEESSIEEVIEEDVSDESVEINDSSEENEMVEVDSDAEATGEVVEEPAAEEPATEFAGPIQISEAVITEVKASKNKAIYTYSCLVNGKEVTGYLEDNNYNVTNAETSGECYSYDVDGDGDEELVFLIFYIGNTLTDTAGNLHIVKFIDGEAVEILNQADESWETPDNYWVVGVDTSKDTLQIETATACPELECASYRWNRYSLEYKDSKWTTELVSSNIDDVKDAFYAYRDYISKSDFPREGGIIVFNLDNDDTPEIMIKGITEADGNIVISCHNGKVAEWYTNRLGCAYIPYSGYVVNSDGHMGYYFEYYRKLTEAGFENAGDLEYYEDENLNYIYTWNGVECSEAEASAEVAKIVPWGYDADDWIEIGYASEDANGWYSSIEDAYKAFFHENM